MSTRIENESPARASRAKPKAQAPEVDLGFLDDVHFGEQRERERIEEYLRKNPEAVAPLRWFKENVPKEFAPNGLYLWYSHGLFHPSDYAAYPSAITIQAHDFSTFAAWQGRPDRAELTLSMARFQGLWRKRFEPVPVSKHLHPSL